MMDGRSDHDWPIYNKFAVGNQMTFLHPHQHKSVIKSQHRLIRSYNRNFTDKTDLNDGDHSLYYYKYTEELEFRHNESFIRPLRRIKT